MNNKDINADEYINLCVRIELAKRHFYDFCKTMVPDFYTDDKTYLKTICDELEKFVNSSEIQVFILNMPPRHGKTLTLDLLCLWMLGRDIYTSIMKASYNTILSSESSKAVRDWIREEKVDVRKLTYSDIFPDTKIKRGDSQLKMWSVENSKVKSYIASSPKASATGFGCKVMLLDDVIKNHEEALRADYLQKLTDWYNNTMRSRAETGAKRIVIQTRWATKDLSGYLIETLTRLNIPYIHINMPLEQEDGTLLCPSLMTPEEYREIKSTMMPEIFEANYNQKPIDIKGRLYTNLLTYYVEKKDKYGKVIAQKDQYGNEITTTFTDETTGEQVVVVEKLKEHEYIKEFDRIFLCCDTADTGEDYLSAIVFGTYKGKIYILDIYYTQEHMETTEPYVADLIHNWKVQYVQIEANNGGRGFYRNVRRIYEEKYRSFGELDDRFTDNPNEHHTQPLGVNDKWYIEWEPFTQNKNKDSRINGEAHNVMRVVRFPLMWSEKWPDAFNHAMSYQRKGKNDHDDFEDNLTQCYELSYSLGFVD